MNQVVYKGKTKNTDLKIIILELLKQGSLIGLDLVDMTLNNYPTLSETRRRWKAKKLREGSRHREKVIGAFFDKQKERQRVHNLLQKLKKDHLIERKSEPKVGFIWRATKRGRRELEKMKSLLYLPQENYISKKEEKCLIVVIFDILEKNRLVRDWLRENLINLGFRKIQQSVYMGEIKLPEDFMEDLRKLNLLPRQVKIFSVNRSGSLFE